MSNARRLGLAVWGFALVLAVASDSLARDAATVLRGLVGYTITAAETVEKVIGEGGGRYIKLSDGTWFRVRFLLLKPLPLTDVIVFKNPIAPQPAGWTRKREPGTRGKVKLDMFKLLIDDEVYDAAREEP